MESLVRQTPHSNNKVNTIAQKLESEINTIRKEMQRQKTYYQQNIDELRGIVATVSDSEEKCMEAIGSLAQTLSNFMDRVFTALATMETKIGLQTQRQLTAVGVVHDVVQFWYTADFTPMKLKRRHCIQSTGGNSQVEFEVSARASSTSAKESDRSIGVVTASDFRLNRNIKKIPGGSLLPVPWLQSRKATLAAAVLRWWFPPRPGLQPFFSFVAFFPKFF